MDVLFVLTGMALFGTGLFLNHKKKGKPNTATKQRRTEHFVGESIFDTLPPLPARENSPGEAREQNPEKPPIKGKEPQESELTHICTKKGNCFWVASVGDGTEIVAAELLSKCRIFFTLMKNYCQKNKIFNSLVRRHENVSIKESDPPVGSDVTSYTMDKQVVSLCLRGDNKKLTDWVFVAYVALHEYAHVATNGTAHDAHFWINFRCLQVIARAQGYWKPDPDNFKFKYCRNIDVEHQMPPSPDPNCDEYKEIINTLQNNTPECDAPFSTWIAENENGKIRNSILRSILYKLPADKGYKDAFSYSQGTW